MLLSGIIEFSLALNWIYWGWFYKAIIIHKLKFINHEPFQAIGAVDQGTAWWIGSFLIKTGAS